MTPTADPIANLLATWAFVRWADQRVLHAARTVPDAEEYHRDRGISHGSVHALVLHMMAAQAGLAAGEFVWTGGDCHIYDNHVEQVTELLSREPRQYPELVLAPRDSIFDYTYEDVVVKNYDPHPGIKAPVAV